MAANRRTILCFWLFWWISWTTPTISSDASRRGLTPEMEANLRQQQVDQTQELKVLQKQLAEHKRTQKQDPSSSTKTPQVQDWERQVKQITRSLEVVSSLLEHADLLQGARIPRNHEGTSNNNNHHRPIAQDEF